MSLFGGKKNIIFYSIALGILIFSVYPLAVKINFSNFMKWINDFNILSLFCVWQIIESTIFMFGTLTAIKLHYSETGGKTAKYFLLLPSIIFLTGLFGCQIYLFNSISGVKFYITSAIFSIGVVMITFISAALIKTIIKYWELRMELRILISIIQIIISMFLPMLITGVKIQDTQLKAEPIKIAITFVSFFLMILTGYKINLKKFRGMFK